jgi:drug/metabolite transporter (DMT)-like permease
MPFGELAALGTATCWAITSLVFAEASRRVGPLRVNLLRLPIALVLLSLALAVLDAPLADLTAARVGLLAASGVIGLVVGDLAFFASLRRLGARVTSLLMSLAPVFAALAGAAFLGEVPRGPGFAGIAVTLGGVAWVVGERHADRRAGPRDPLGILLGVTGAACQGIGLVLAKLGMAGQVAPLTATWVRIGVATVLIWALTATSRHIGDLGVTAGMRSAGPFIAAGAFFGPFLGVTLSLTAAKLTEVGIAATIMATSPVLVIPMVMATEGYRPSLRAVLGTAVAIAGVALLFSR